jgi:beta-carotene 3-hydroxylase
MIQFLYVLAAFVSMEGVAWLSHKYLMHGLMWALHKDHHQKNPERVLEKNDSFFVLFAIPGIILILLGTMYGSQAPYLWLGLGITLYGVAYFLVHDVFIHQRLKIFRRADNFYLRAIRKAHKMHHKHLDRFEGECFGMLWVPVKYFREALRKGA